MMTNEERTRFVFKALWNTDTKIQDVRIIVEAWEEELKELREDKLSKKVSP